MASRRRCDEYITSGRVSIDGQVVATLGHRVDPATQRVALDGAVIVPAGSYRYVLLNKPMGYIVSARDPFHGRTVFDLLRGVPERLFPIGRLDLDTEGVLLLTSDGELAFRLAHPRYAVSKAYRARVEGIPCEEALRSLSVGVKLDEKLTAPAQVSLLRSNGPAAELELVVHEGRKRQVRRMCEAVGHPVTHLERTEFGGITARGLAPGAWRDLTGQEIGRLRRLVHL